MLATGDSAGKTTIYDLKTKSKIHEWNHKRTVNSVCFSPDGSLLATGDCAKKTTIYDLDSNIKHQLLIKRQLFMDNLTHTKHKASFLHDLKVYFVACCFDKLKGEKIIKKYNLSFNTETATIKGQSLNYVKVTVNDSSDYKQYLVDPQRVGDFTTRFVEWIKDVKNRKACHVVVTDPGPGHKQENKQTLMCQDADDSIALMMMPSINHLYISDEIHDWFCPRTIAACCYARFNELKTRCDHMACLNYKNNCHGILNILMQVNGDENDTSLDFKRQEIQCILDQDYKKDAEMCIEKRRLGMEPKTGFDTKYMFLNLYNNRLNREERNALSDAAFVCERDDYFAFIPAVRNGSVQRINEKLSRAGSCPMSALHVLVCPKFELINATDIDEMLQFDFDAAKKVGKEALQQLVREGMDHDGAKRGLETRVKEINDNKQWSNTLMNQHVDIPFELAQKIALDPKNYEYSFHLHPRNSVEHLHMHVWIPLLATKSLDAQLRYYPLKNTPFKVIQDIVDAKKDAKKNKHMKILTEKFFDWTKVDYKNDSTSLYEQYTYGC